MRKPVIQVIFQSKNGTPREPWLDYCREPAPEHMNEKQATAWAQAQCDRLERERPIQFRFRLEMWR
jgi:hypothetical protein